jgi:hypothetical protein
MIDLHTATASASAAGLVGIDDGVDAGFDAAAVVVGVEVAAVAVEPLWLLEVELLPPPPQPAITAPPNAANTSHVDSCLVI